jgi:hypothetical protein
MFSSSPITGKRSKGLKPLVWPRHCSAETRAQDKKFASQLPCKILQTAGWNLTNAAGSSWKPQAESRTYPRTLILENDNTARDEIGRPIDIAGRNVVKISILFTCGSSS